MRKSRRSRKAACTRQRVSYWSPYTERFDHHKFVIAKLLKVPWAALVQRPQHIQVHLVGDIAKSQVPDPVFNFLGKSDKLVPVTRLPSWKKFYEAVDDFQYRLRVQLAFRNLRHVRVDPLTGLRRRFSKNSSQWKPSPEQLPKDIDKYCSYTKADLCWAFHLARTAEAQKRQPRNLSSADRWAIKWLSGNSDFLDVPTDKGLGTALIRKTHYDSLASAALNKSYVEVSWGTVQETVDRAKSDIHNILEFAQQFKLLHRKVIGFATCLFEDAESRLPIGRQLIKVHKPVTESRMIASGVRWVTNPIAVILASFMQPVVNSFESVAKDTKDVVQAVSNMAVDGGSNVYAATFDVKDLYPSIEHGPCKAACITILCEYFRDRGVANWGALVEMLINMVDVVFRSQLLTYRFQQSGEKLYYLQTTGMTTGLSCACQIANLFLRGLDRMVARDFNMHLLAYKRFIDDILVVTRTRQIISEILAAMNNWQSAITVTQDADENPKSVHFLDLWIHVSGAQVKYETYRKPLCLYMYTPFNSCHPFSVKRGIVLTELRRLLLTNSCESDFDHHRQLLFSKLKARGYPWALLDEASQQRLWANKQTLLSRQSLATSRQLIPFKIKYSPLVQGARITEALYRHAYFICADSDKPFHFVTCFLSNANLFRQRFTRFV